MGRTVSSVPSEKIAAQTGCFAEPIKKALQTIARLGCAGVQIDARHELRPAELSQTGLRHMRKMLVDLNLRVGSLTFLTRRGLACSADLEQRLDATRAAMQLASQLDARILVCNLGSFSEDPHAPERASLVDGLANLAVLGNRLGVRIALQGAATPVDRLVDLLAALPDGTAGLDLHPAQLIAHDQSPQEFVAAAGHAIVHVHAVDGVYDLGSGHGVEVELGRGSVDFPEMLGALEEHGYRGWFTIERRGSPHPAEDVHNAVEFLRAL
ncbi:MAG: sugar phosphate isomerase/epimerase [Pirellulales bacterium]|nr:sugar phosphate isomerase/epimerase [Pirellulales bacterium]